MNIRPATPTDIDAIRRVVHAAFGRPDEATLVDGLRADGDLLLSLVAEVTSEGQLLPRSALGADETTPDETTPGYSAPGYSAPGDGDTGDDARELIGHIAFSPLRLRPGGTVSNPVSDSHPDDSHPDDPHPDGPIDPVPGPAWLGLAPVAVVPEQQGKGIGGALIRAGIAACRQLGTPVVALLGHPTYYPRFGFRPAHELGLRYEADVPPEAFMALELVPGAAARALGQFPAAAGDPARGILSYASAFARLAG